MSDKQQNPEKPTALASTASGCYKAAPRLCDGFCKQGGAGVGYARAGFNVEGVDIEPQPRYPFTFHLGDALEFIDNNRDHFDAFHVSPPCQGWTKARNLWGRAYQDWIEPSRDLLNEIGKPYIIENVPGAPLRNPTVLTGMMFGLKTVRKRLFETNFELPFLLSPPQAAPNAKMGRPPRNGEYIQCVGHFSNVEYGKKAMGIDWMNQDGLAQAIPPAYTEWVGRHLLAHLQKAL